MNWLRVQRGGDGEVQWKAGIESFVDVEVRQKRRVDVDVEVQKETHTPKPLVKQEYTASLTVAGGVVREAGGLCQGAGQKVFVGPRGCFVVSEKEVFVLRRS